MSNNSNRIALTKCRCSNSKMPVHNQIYMYDTDMCTLCDLNLVGDEYHYLPICPYLLNPEKLTCKFILYCRPTSLKFEQLLTNKKQIQNQSKQSRFTSIILNFMFHLS